MSGRNIEVFIVDDHNLIIEGLRSSLENESDITVVGSATSGKGCLHFFKDNRADVVLMDISLPDCNGIDLCTAVLKQRPGTRILGLSTHNQRSYISKLMDHGARGYMLKNANVSEIKEAIRDVYKGHVFFSKEAVDTLYQSNAPVSEDHVPLTRREQEILKLIVDGLTAPEIAAKLFVSQLTVESHRRNMMAKLKAKNIATLIKIAMGGNLI